MKLETRMKNHQQRDCNAQPDIVVKPVSDVAVTMHGAEALADGVKQEQLRNSLQLHAVTLSDRIGLVVKID